MNAHVGMSMIRRKVIMQMGLNLEQLSRTCPMIGYALNAVLRKNTSKKQIEEYIHDHSEAEFTHSICEECAGRLYPEFVKKNNPKSQN